LRAAVLVTDPAGRWKKSLSDGFGELVEVKEPRPGGGEYSTTYTYSALGKLRTVTMPRDGVTQTRTFEYNVGGSLCRTIFPETGTTTYSYVGGRLSTQTDAVGRMRKWVYETGVWRWSTLKLVFLPPVWQLSTKAAVAGVIMNRWQFVNGFFRLRDQNETAYG
jgi:YD repeat-containing protein